MKIETEEDVVNRLRRYFAEEHEAMVDVEEPIPADNGASWICDIYVRGYLDSPVAIECKYDSQVRKGIGQAFSYYSEGFESGLAFHDVPPKYETLLAEQPFPVWVVSEDEVVRLDSGSTISKITQLRERIEDLEESVAEQRRRRHSIEQELAQVKMEKDRLESEIEGLPISV